MALFGKKDKTPFKIPHEVIALRGRIDTQLRENFPNLEQYQEIMKEAEQVLLSLNEVIRGKEHTEEATRLRDDLKSRLKQLAAKIKKNRTEADSAASEKFDEDEMDSLRRKTLRNNAKSLFTDLLEQVESLKKCCLGGQAGPGRSLDSIAMDVVRSVTALNSSFFKMHGTDWEIDDLKREVMQLPNQLNGFLEQNKAAITEKGLETKAVMAVMKITTATSLISP